MHGCSPGADLDLSPTTAVVSDMSSNFCSKPIDVKSHGLVYAGVQKNLGPAGMAVVIIKNDLMRKPQEKCPIYLDYQLLHKNDSMYNTPPCWNIYMVGLMVKYLLSTGGLAEWKERTEQKSQRIYDVIDNSDGFYTNPVKKEFRSCMNIPFRVENNNALEESFIKEAETQANCIQLKGHRSLPGCRASLYNGMPMEGVEALAAFMKSFQEEHSK
eukprot:Platyproteum_vivax@DN1244_c0_g1_i2.p1